MDRGKNSTVRKSYTRKEEAGLSNGITKRSDFMAGETVSDADFNQSGSGSAGFTRQVKGKRDQSSVKEKGNSFQLEG